MPQSLPVVAVCPPAHTVPSRSSDIESTIHPSNALYRVSWPSLRLASSLRVPIQRVPSLAVNRVRMKLLRKDSPGGGCQRTFRIPSKRSKPNSVPSQRYPSGVWAIEVTLPLEKPSRIFHDVWAY